MVKLNIGSGQRRFDNAHGWVNIDRISRPPDQVPDFICDVGKERLPYQDGTVDMVVLHHVLEHFGCGEGVALIQECHRVLRYGGSLQIFVPDMQALAMAWLDEGRISTQVYMTNVYGAYQGEESDRHKWGYDFVSLSAHLKDSCKWRVIMSPRYDFPGADIAKDWWILGMECVK